MWKIWAIKSFSNCVDDRSKKQVYHNWEWCKLTLCAISFSSTRRTPWLFTWSTALEKWLGGLVWRAAPLHFCRSSQLQVECLSPSGRQGRSQCLNIFVGQSWFLLAASFSMTWIDYHRGFVPMFSGCALLVEKEPWKSFSFLCSCWSINNDL